MRVLCLKNYENKIGKTGLYLFTLSIFISKAGVNIGLLLMFLSFCLILIRDRKIYLENEEKYILTFLLALPFWSLFSPGGVNSFLINLQKDYRYLGLFLIPLFIRNKKKLRNILILLGLSLIINFSKGIYFYNKLVHWNLSYRYRSFPGNTLDDAHMMAMFGVMLFTVLFYFIKNKKYKYQILIGLMLIISVIILILTQGRGAWLAFMGSLIIVIFFITQNKYKVLLGLTVIFSLIYMLVNMNPKIENNIYFKRFVSIKNVDEDSSKIRILMWKSSIETFKETFPFGAGRRNAQIYVLEYLEKNNLYKEVKKPKNLKNVAKSAMFHDIYFGSLAEEGIFVIPFIGMFIYIFYSQLIFLKKLKKDSLYYYVILGTIGSLIAFCIGGLTENVWHEIWKTNFFSFFMGLYLGTKNIVKLENKN